MADTETKSETRGRLLDWLRDAHAMEKQAAQMLSTMESRIEHYPDLRRRIAQHMKETETQATRLEDCIKSLGGAPSSVKDATGTIMGMIHTLPNALAGDEVMKGTLAGYTFEHFEIAAYRILIAAATTLGEAAVAETCRKNLREEEEMAQWFSQNIDQLTAHYLEREDKGETAKR